jgi:hypothetical protein
MGYGLADCVLLINRGSDFSSALDYYTLFQYEPGPSSMMDLNLYPPDPADRFTTFLGLINRMIANAVTGTLLVLNHGRSDDDDDPVGLSLPLTDKNPDIIPTIEVLNLLAQLLDEDGDPTDKEFADLEQKNTFTPVRGRNKGKELHLAPGTLKSLYWALLVLRGKHLDRVDIRACNLGRKSIGADLMNGLGRVWGAKVVTAPDAHMFMGRLRVGARPASTKVLSDWVSKRSVATRQFSDPNDASMQLAVNVIGDGLARHIDTIATTTQLGWFVGRGFITTGMTLPPPPTPLPIIGMDMPGHTFALPWENEYVWHLTSVTVSDTPPSLRGP